MSEQSAWTTIRTHLTSLGVVHVQRVEDKLTPGVADANVCLEGVEFWLEGKYLKALPARDTTRVKVGLTPEQVNWHTLRRRAGGRTFVWVRVRDWGWLLFEERLCRLAEGIPLSEFKKEPVFKTGKDLVAELARRL